MISHTKKERYPLLLPLAIGLLSVNAMNTPSTFHDTSQDQGISPFTCITSSEKGEYSLAAYVLKNSEQ